jgi:hypothetical protein
LGSIRQILTLFMVVAAILAFAGMFGLGFYQTWNSPPDTTPKYSEPFLYVAIALAALVGGIVAVGFGQKPPTNLSAQVSEPLIHGRHICRGVCLLGNHRSNNLGSFK